MNDNKLLLVTTAVDQRFQIYALFCLKNVVKKLLKINVENHNCFEVDQSNDSPILPPEKPQPSVNFDPNKFST